MGKKRFFQKLTIFVMADANQSVKRVRVPGILLYGLAVAVPCIIGTLAAASYYFADSRTAALEANALIREEWSSEVSRKEEAIRTKNAEIALLQEEIVRLTQETQAIAAKVAELQTLEREILQFTGDGGGGGNSTELRPAAQADSRTEGAAALSPAVALTGGSLPTYLNSPVQILSSGVGGLYYPTEPAGTIELSSQTLQSLEQLSAEADRLGQSLEEALAAAEKLQYLRSITPSIYPTTSTRITSTFGTRKDPFTRRNAQHNGIDFGGRTGDPVFATADGTVTSVGYDRAAGNHIVIRHGNGIETVYMHLSKTLVKKGQNVKKGEQIGKLGSTGRSTGPHLHYEVHRNGKPVNPKQYLQDLGG